MEETKKQAQEARKRAEQARNQQRTPSTPASNEVYREAWNIYRSAWSAIDTASNAAHSVNSIPWPALPNQEVKASTVQAFMRFAATTNAEFTVKALKTERLHWHPDKIQQRFGVKSGSEIMARVNEVFDTVQSMLRSEQMRAMATRG